MTGLIAKTIHPAAKSHTFRRVKSARYDPAIIPNRMELHLRQARAPTVQTLGFSNFIASYSGRMSGGTRQSRMEQGGLTIGNAPKRIETLWGNKRRRHGK